MQIVLDIREFAVEVIRESPMIRRTIRAALLRGVDIWCRSDQMDYLAEFKRHYNLEP